MASADTTINVEDTIVATIQDLVSRRGATDLVVRPESNLLADLAMDSLELAELSAALADEIGRDPFSEGKFPETVAELIAYYNP